jgi:protein-disulfide isomerase
MKQTTKLFTFFLTLVLFAISFGCGSTPENKATTNTAAKTGNGAAGNTANTSAADLYSKAPAGAQPPNMLGSPTATVTVEEFADFQCPSCAQIHTIMKEVQTGYGNKIKFIYRHYPLSQMHKNAYDAALAAEAAGQQNQFWAMQNQLFTNQQAWSNSTNVRPVFVEYAQKLGLDVQRFQSDLLAISTKLRVDDDIKRGNALNLNSTPSLFINGKAVPFQQMNLNAIRSIIDAELQSAGNAKTTAPASATNTAATAVPAANTATNAAANTTANSNAAKAPGK